MVLRGSEATVSDLVRAGVRGSQVVDTDHLEMHSSAQALTAAREANITHRARDVVSLSPQIELHDEPDLLRFRLRSLTPIPSASSGLSSPQKEWITGWRQWLLSLSRPACP